MKIGFAADTYKPYTSGVTNYISLHKAELERLGHEVTLFAFGERRDLPAEAGVIYSPGFRLKMGYSFGLRYSKTALEQLYRMDIVHLHHPFVTGQLVLSECKPRGIPMVFTGHTRYDQFFHDYLPWMPEKWGIALLKTYLPGFCRQMDRVISNSNASEEGLRNCGVDVDLCRMPNGIDPEPFFRAKRDDSLRWRLAGDSQMVYLFVGRLAVEKNLDLLFKAFAVLCRKHPSAQLVMVGTGPLEMTYRKQIADSEIGAKVVFTGIIPYSELPAYFKAADAFVMPSIHDAHPLAVIEAMASGLPLVVVDSPAYYGTVVDGGNGVFCQNEAASFEAGLKRLLVDPVLRRQMGDCSREMSEQFGVERTAGKLVTLYEEILAERKPA
jgi:1,2-diacylglycerol 3-alpha-glucosyltransferase